MKLTKYFMPLAAIALLASCSNDNKVEVPDSPKNPETNVDANVAFNLQLVADPSSRAEYEYADGERNEYAIDNGYVYLFYGTDESDAIFVESATLMLPVFADYGDNNDYVTQTGTVKAKLENTSATTSSYFVALVLNVDSKPADPSGKTMQEWIAEDQGITSFTHTANDNTYFTMTNAPSYSGQSGQGISYLAKLSDEWKTNQTDQIYAATIYVQRVASKVTLNTNASYNVTANGTTTLTVDGWTLDNTAKKSYLFQNVYNDLQNDDDDMVWLSGSPNLTSANDSRFYAYPTNGIFAHNRVFWSKDFDYDIDGTFDSYTDMTATTLTPLYTHENTFDVAHMTKENTTRVLIEATVNPDLGSGNAVGADGGFFKNINTELIYSKSTLEAAMNTALGVSNVTINPDSYEAGYYSLEDLNIKIGDEDITPDQMLVLISKMNLPSSDLAYYKDCKTYYQILVRHFNNNELGADFFNGTPQWEMTENGYYINETVASGVNDLNFLGRYGMVRNNWYDLTIQTITKIGYPEPPTPDDEWDDDPKEYNIQVNIAILAWAKRHFDYNL